MRDAYETVSKTQSKKLTGRFVHPSRFPRPHDQHPFSRAVGYLLLFTNIGVTQGHSPTLRRKFPL